MKSITAIFLVIMLVAMAGASLAADNAMDIDPSKIPVKITSNRMVYDEKGGSVTFLDNVVAEHGELTLWSEKLIAYLGPEKEGQTEAIDHIVAEGNVRAKKGTMKGTCGKLTYVVGTQYLKMEKDPKLQDGPNSLSGKIIKFYARENRSEVMGGKNQRVKAIFLAPGGEK